MAVSFFTHYVINQIDEGRFENAESAFSHCRNLGIRYGDLLGRLEDYPLHMHCDIMRGCGIEPSSLIDGFGISDFDKNKRRAEVSRAKEKIDIMSKLSIPIFMLVPEIICVRSNDEKERHKELLCESYAELCKYAKGSGVTVTLENQSISTRPDAKITDIAEMLDTVPELMYVLDCGNYICVGEDVIEAYEKLKSRTVHMHVKDWNYSEYGEFVRENMPRFKGAPLGTGFVPLEEIAVKTLADGYKGCAAVEINSPVTWEEFDNSVKLAVERFGV